MASWIREALTAAWEIPSQYSKFTEFMQLSGPDTKVVIVAFSVGLDAKGRPTPANQRIIEKVWELYRIGRCAHTGARITTMFCTGINQPSVGIASSVAMAQYVRTAKIPIDRNDITLDDTSTDTVGNAEAVAMHVKKSFDSRRPAIVLVCHPLHARRSELCLKRSLVRLCHPPNQPALPPINVFVVPAPYARDHKGVRIYAPTPNQPWLKSHSRFLAYEVITFLLMKVRLYGLAAKVKSFLNRRHSSASS